MQRRQLTRGRGWRTCSPPDLRDRANRALILSHVIVLNRYVLKMTSRGNHKYLPSRDDTHGYRQKTLFSIF
jgi:hypothetical protein